MSSTCFDPEGSASGRRLYMQIWFSLFYMHQYKQSWMQKSVSGTEVTLPTSQTSVQNKLVYTTVFLKMNSRVRNTYAKVKVKVKVTLVQAMRLCTVRTAHRGSRGIALPFHNHGTRMG